MQEVSLQRARPVWRRNGTEKMVVGLLSAPHPFRRPPRVSPSSPLDKLTVGDERLGEIKAQPSPGY